MNGGRRFSRPALHLPTPSAHPEPAAHPIPLILNLLKDGRKELPGKGCSSFNKFRMSGWGLAYERMVAAAEPFILNSVEG